MTYAIIDPRDGHTVDYAEGLANARVRARDLAQSPIHPYKPYGVRFIIRKVNAA